MRLTRKARREVPAKEKTMSEKQTVEAGNSLPPPLGSPMIIFRCMFCGREFATVEECNACEAQH
jgi:hypothetical protein